MIGNELRYKVNFISRKIKRKGSYIYFLIDGNDIKLVSYGRKDEARKECLKKIKEKYEYIGNSIYEIKLIARSRYIEQDNDIIIGGPVLLRIYKYIISENHELIETLTEKYDPKNGIVCYTEKDILDNKFSFKDVMIIIKKIHDRNINILAHNKIRAVDILSLE